MDHATAVCVGDGFEDALDGRQQLRRGLSLLDPVVPRRPFDVLEDECRGIEVQHVVDRRDARVIQGRERPGFVQHALAGLPALQRDVAQPLDRDAPVEHEVVGQVDGAHATTTELADEPVAPDEHLLRAALAANVGDGHLSCHGLGHYRSGGRA